MLQALKLLANADLQALGYNSAQYIHLLYQAMNLASPIATSTGAILPLRLKKTSQACSARHAQRRGLRR